MKISRYILALLMSVSLVGVSNAENISYVESANGDLANDETMPTDVGITDIGLNTVSGTLSNTANFDPDSFLFEVGAGQQLDSVSFGSMSGNAGFDHFLAFSDTTLSRSPGDNLITTLIDTSSVGVNLIDGNWVSTYGGRGASGPLPSGTYHLWFQETDGMDYDYSINIVTSQAIPEPTMAIVPMVLGLIAAAKRRRRS